MKERIVKIAPCIIGFYLFNLFSQLYERINPNLKFSDKVLIFILNINHTFDSLLLSIQIKDIFVGIVGAITLKLVVYVKMSKAKKYRNGIEYGSAKWGNSKDIKPYMDIRDKENNIILTQTEGLRMNGRSKKTKYERNKNVLVVGGSGSGKTRFVVKPNLMQMHSSYVVLDPKGQVLNETGKMLEKHGYRVKVLNTIEFNKSMKYNPFQYLKSEKDILKLVNVLMENTKGEGEKTENGGFWDKAEKLYYTALIAYIHYEVVQEEQNFATLVDMINASEVREEDENFKNPIDELFDELEEREPNHFAVRQYKKYKLAAGKTAKSIMISCGARLAPFDVEELRNLMMEDEMEVDRLGEEKTALFIIVSDTDTTFNFVVSMMYSQMFNLLCEKADNVYNGKLPVHVRVMADEFANCGKIPNFERVISTIRSRNISVTIILQTKSQLKAIYKDNATIIEGNCDSILFLGGKEQTTLKDISEMLGKETIDICNTSDTRGSSRSYGINYQKTGKALMTPDELAIMDSDKCILQVRGIRPFLSKKYDITKHKMYKELSDYNQKNKFDINRYIAKQRKNK